MRPTIRGSDVFVKEDLRSIPAFLAEIEQRRRQRDERWQAAIGTTWTTEIEHTDRRLLR